MSDDPVVKWEPEAKPAPGEGRHWGRALALVLAPIAVVLVALRAMARLPDATAYETGYVLGQLFFVPIVFGAIAWGVVVALRRRSGRKEKVLSLGLVAWISALAILVWITSIGR